MNWRCWVEYVDNIDIASRLIGSGNDSSLKTESERWADSDVSAIISSQLPDKGLHIFMFGSSYNGEGSFWIRLWWARANILLLFWLCFENAEGWWPLWAEEDSLYHLWMSSFSNDPPVNDVGFMCLGLCNLWMYTQNPISKKKENVCQIHSRLKLLTLMLAHPKTI